MQAGPGGSEGGIEWSTATDTQRIYVPITNSENVATMLLPSRQTVNGSFWEALDAATGAVLCQYAGGGSVVDGPAIVGDRLYWGSGYITGAGGVKVTENNKLCAFGLPGTP